MKLKLPHKVYTIAKILHSAGYQCFLVGGAVRTGLGALHGLGHPATDFDFATDAPPEEVSRIFHRVIPTGIAHGTVTVLLQGESFEVTTFRSEEGYSDSRHPDRIQYLSTIDEDLHRRDFTINAMAYDPLTHTLLDPTEGRRDLKRGIIRAIGQPEERFREDPLRQLRAFRFMGQLEFTIEEKTLRAITEHREAILQVSPERIKDEMDKLLKTERPSLALRAMEKTGFLRQILPELSHCRGIEQKGYHRYDVFEHSIRACDGAPPDLILRWAALLHDIGKVPTRQFDDSGIVTFHSHEQASAELADSICRRYRFSNASRERIVHLIRQHMYHYEPDQWSDGAVRRFISRVGTNALEDLFALRRADRYGMGGQVPCGRNRDTEELRIRIADIMSRDNALSVKDLSVNGKDLMEHGIPAGPVLGSILQELLDTVMDDPGMNQPDKLLPLAQNLYARDQSGEPSGLHRQK